MTSDFLKENCSFAMSSCTASVLHPPLGLCAFHSRPVLLCAACAGCRYGLTRAAQVWRSLGRSSTRLVLITWVCPCQGELPGASTVLHEAVEEAHSATAHCGDTPPPPGYAEWASAIKERGLNSRSASNLRHGRS